MFFCPLDQPCMTLQTVQVAPNSEHFSNYFNYDLNNYVFRRVQALTKLPDEIIYGSEYLQVMWRVAA